MVSVEYVEISPFLLSERAKAYDVLAMNVNPKLTGREIEDVRHNEVISGLEKGIEQARVFLSAQITYKS